MLKPTGMPSLHVSMRTMRFSTEGCQRGSGLSHADVADECLTGSCLDVADFISRVRVPQQPGEPQVRRPRAAPPARRHPPKQPHCRLPAESLQCTAQSVACTPSCHHRCAKSVGPLQYFASGQLQRGVSFADDCLQPGLHNSTSWTEIAALAGGTAVPHDTALCICTFGSMQGCCTCALC